MGVFATSTRGLIVEKQLVWTGYMLEYLSILIYPRGDND